MYGYGDDDLNRTEGPEEKESGDEDSRESNSVSISLQSCGDRVLSRFDGCCQSSLGVVLTMCWLRFGEFSGWWFYGFSVASTGQQCMFVLVEKHNHTKGCKSQQK